MPSTTYNLPKITTNTLVSGYVSQTGKTNDLAPKLDEKLVIVPDASRLMSLRSDDKAIIFSQLRDLYDGFAGKQTGGSRSKKTYKNLKVTMLWAATPQIEDEIIFHGDLGTRFLMYNYIPPKDKKIMEIMSKRKGDLTELKKASGELERKLCRRIEKEKSWEDVNIEDTKKELMNLSNYLANMRAPAEVDRFTKEVTDKVAKEKPTRIFGQFITLFKSLMSLDENYSHKKAIAIIKHVAYSSSDKLRTNVLKVIEQTKSSITADDIADILHIGRNTVLMRCNILWNLKLIDKTYIDGGYRDIMAWKKSTLSHINDNVKKVKIMVPDKLIARNR